MVINDNEMSIAPNSGGLYKNLALLRETKGTAECNFFKALGYDYYYVDEGNNIEKLISAFQKVKDIDHPVVVHIHTLKGKGLPQAEINKEAFHWILPGMLDNKPVDIQDENYNTITTEYILNKAAKDPKIIAISPATPGAYGFTPEFREKLGKQYKDVGIAEEHAVAFASALAKAGAKPILAIMSSFIQRTYDQLSQDLALNNSPATLLIHWGAITSADATHLGCFDISMISNIPNLVYLAPTCKEEYLAMLDWSVEQTTYPVAIRVPFGEYITTGKIYKQDFSDLNKFKKVIEGYDVAIIGAGNFFNLGEKVYNRLKESGINATLINPRFLTGIDTEMLEELKQNHKVVITLEDGILDGGFGEKITRFYGSSGMKVINYGANKVFTDRMSLDELYQKYRLKDYLIIEDILKLVL